MSVYSGFTTRHQEVTYNRLTETLLLLLQDRLLSLQRHDLPTDRFWLEQFNSVYSQMSRMEVHKYFPPKLTQCVRDLAASHGLGDLEVPVNLSTAHHHKAGTARNSYRRSVSPRKDLSLLMPEDFAVPVTTQRARRKKRAVRKPKKENEGKYTIEWADLKPKSRNYYNGLLLKKLAKPPQSRWGGSQLQWRDF